MAAPKVDIEITQGENFLFQFAYTDAALSPIDFAGHVLAMQIRADLDSPVAITLSSTNGKLSWNPTGGVFTARLTPAETMRLKLVDSGVYDLFAKAPDGSAARQLVRGDVTFTRAVTR